LNAYHIGERIVQERVGLLERGGTSLAAVKAEIPEVAMDFLARQPMLVIGTADTCGNMWASLLTGSPGFITVTGPSSLTVGTGLPAGDPLCETLSRPAPLGTLAIEPATRRRMRMNGTAGPTADGFSIDMDEVYANCPKYIQKREYATAPVQPRSAQRGRRLTTRQQQFIARADTFFIATADGAGNADASHRGGDPGFLRPLSATRLRWPDYVGNAMFNTLGNMEVNPRAGLLLPDWNSGTTLQLSGTAHVDWDPERAAAIPGAQRIVEFDIEHVVEIAGASPLRWTAPTYSRFNPRPSKEHPQGHEDHRGRQCL
jgi:predicted pyridoxine 5'-phosphate oxidase superfamily flavin-nucleotide-binding protein